MISPAGEVANGDCLTLATRQQVATISFASLRSIVALCPWTLLPAPSTSICPPLTRARIVDEHRWVVETLHI